MFTLKKGVLLAAVATTGYNIPMLPIAGLFWALTICFYSAVAFAIWRIFQIGRLSEIKRLLLDIRADQNLPR
jgi:hypothetical protein